MSVQGLFRISLNIMISQEYHDGKLECWKDILEFTSVDTTIKTQLRDGQNKRFFRNISNSRQLVGICFRTDGGDSDPAQF